MVSMVNGSVLLAGPHITLPKCRHEWLCIFQCLLMVIKQLVDLVRTGLHSKINNKVVKENTTGSGIMNTLGICLQTVLNDWFHGWLMGILANFNLLDWLADLLFLIGLRNLVIMVGSILLLLIILGLVLHFSLDFSLSFSFSFLFML